MHNYELLRCFIVKINFSNREIVKKAISFCPLKMIEHNGQVISTNFSEWFLWPAVSLVLRKQAITSNQLSILVFSREDFKQQYEVQVCLINPGPQIITCHLHGRNYVKSAKSIKMHFQLTGKSKQFHCVLPQRIIRKLMPRGRRVNTYSIP